MTGLGVAGALAQLVRRLAAWLERGAADRTRRKIGSCGSGVEFKGRITITDPESVIIEDNVHIGDGAFIKGEGGLRIGANTHISRNLVVYTVNHRHHGDRLPYDEVLVERPVEIGRNVWIGMGVSIAPGTIIGDGAIIGMGAVVHGEVPSLAIVGAGSWRQIGSRDPGHYQQLDERRAYGGRDGRPLDTP